jgi:hypothetical protein
MGLFDRLLGKKVSAPAPPATAGAESAALPPPEPAMVLPRLAAARACLEARDLPGALALYEQVLAEAGERADVLVTISGDLGQHGHVQQIVEFIAPRYDAERHGPATGLNVLQAYLALHNADAAQHVLDLLFSLHRPELAERLQGFSNAIAELLEEQQSGLLAPPPEGSAAGIVTPRVSLITVSKPIWFYGLEPLAAEILPPKESRLRRIAFAPLALPGSVEQGEVPKGPPLELGRLARALPCWFAETLYFCPHYAPLAVVALLDDQQNGNQYAFFGVEWAADNIRQLVSATQEGIDFVITGALTEDAGDYELVLRLWEVKKIRERKQFTAHWTSATADAGLTALNAALGQFMECTPYPAGTGLAYAPTATPRAWLDTLDASLGLFLADKSLLPAARLASLAEDFDQAAAQTASSAVASLAWLTLRARAVRLGLMPAVADATLAPDEIVAKARAAIES